MRIRVTAQGERELARKLAALPAAIGRPVRERVLLDAAEPMRAQAQRLAPRRSGELALHVEKEVASGDQFLGGDEAQVAVGISRDVFYGLFQELGSVIHDARPWLRPAFDREKHALVERAREGLRREIEKVAIGA